jgi:hypothetical protein
MTGAAKPVATATAAHCNTSRDRSFTLIMTMPPPFFYDLQDEGGLRIRQLAVRLRRVLLLSLTVSAGKHCVTSIREMAKQAGERTLRTACARGSDRFRRKMVLPERIEL